MNDTQKANKDIGLLLKRERKKKGLSQSQISEIMGVKIDVARNYELGRTIVPAVYVQNFCKTFKLNPNKILEVK